jgi:acid stress chaperone HdeB
MKLLRFLATSSLAMLQLGAFSQIASAEKIDISTVSCNHLLQSIESGSENDKSGMGGILYWIAGYTATDEQGSVIDFTALAKDFDKILAGCKSQPNVGLLTVASKYLGENATEQGSAAMDLATLTCQAAVSTKKDEDEGLGFILMWIAGWHASDSEDKIFDTESFVADMQKIGEYCGTNPTVGLLTASDEVMGEDDDDDSEAQ